MAVSIAEAILWGEQLEQQLAATIAMRSFVSIAEAILWGEQLHKQPPQHRNR